MIKLIKESASYKLSEESQIHVDAYKFLYETFYDNLYHHLENGHDIPACIDLAHQMKDIFTDTMYDDCSSMTLCRTFIDHVINELDFFAMAKELISEVNYDFSNSNR